MASSHVVRTAFIQFVMANRLMGPSKDNSAIAATNRPVWYYKKGNFRKAIELFREALLLSLESLPASYWDAVSKRCQVSGVIPTSRYLYDKIDVNGSIHFFDSVETIKQTESPQTTVSVVLFNMAQTLRQMGDFRGALHCYQRAYFMDPRSTNPVMLFLLHNIEQIFYCMVGDDARVLLRRYMGKGATRMLMEERKKAMESTSWELTSDSSDESTSKLNGSERSRRWSFASIVTLGSR